MSWSDMNTNQLTKLKDIPLKALTYDTRCKIGYNLNSNGRVVVLKDVDNGYDIVIENNIKGIAELAGFTGKQIFNIILQSDPTMDFIQQWSEREGTVGQFCEYLMQIQRLDILEECGQDILNDCREYKTRKMNTKSCTSSVSSYFPLKCSDHLSENISNSFDECDLKTAEEKADRISSDSGNEEFKAVTIDDVLTGHDRTRYHAFICYSVESENDRAFVKDLIEVLEKGRGLKLFIPGRDDIPGSAEHSVNAYIIEKRCGTSVVLLSKDFLRSEVCEFQLKFTHALSPAARSHRLIPVIIHKNVQVPRFLGFLAMCDFSSTDFSDWVWNRLFSAIQTNNDTKNRNGSGILEDSLKDISFPVTRRLNE